MTVQDTRSGARWDRAHAHFAAIAHWIWWHISYNVSAIYAVGDQVSQAAAAAFSWGASKTMQGLGYVCRNMCVDVCIDIRTDMWMCIDMRADNILVLASAKQHICYGPDQKSYLLWPRPGNILVMASTKQHISYKVILVMLASYV